MTSDYLTVSLYAFASGITILLGGGLARVDVLPESQVKERILHAMIAFGGGVLVAAVAFVLVPRGVEELSLPLITFYFLSGAVVFFLLVRKIGMGGTKVSQLIAMMIDFIPEAIALGAVFAHDKNLGLLLAIFIGLQNFPEGFNSFRELVNYGFSPNKTLLVLLPLSLTGMLGACLGFHVLHDEPTAIAALMLFAGGGIIYLTFQDIAPMSHTGKYWSPALGASLGFFTGVLGHELVMG